MENKKVSVWKQCKPYMAGLQLPSLIAVVAAVISSIITVYGPTKIKEITNLISRWLGYRNRLGSCVKHCWIFGCPICVWSYP